MSDVDDGSRTIHVSGLGCGLLVFGICLLLTLTSPVFWNGLRTVVEAWKP